MLSNRDREGAMSSMEWPTKGDADAYRKGTGRLRSRLGKSECYRTATAREPVLFLQSSTNFFNGVLQPATHFQTLSVKPVPGSVVPENAAPVPASPSSSARS